MAISLSQKVQYNLQTEQIDSTESITYPDTRMVMKIVFYGYFFIAKSPI